MDCTDARASLSAHIDGELEGADAAALEIHLASCGACRREAEQLRRLARDLRPVVTPPAVADEEWDALLLRAVSRHGERLGWLLLVPAVLALTAGGLAAFLFDAGIPLWVRLAFGAVTAGVVFLSVSAAADRWRARRIERYERVLR